MHPGPVVLGGSATAAAQGRSPELCRPRSRSSAAQDLTEREDGEKGEREKGAERGEGEKGRREWRKKGVISLRGGGSTVSCDR